MRVPRSGSMILGMFLALMMTSLLPVVFLAALAQSADAHPRSLKETRGELGRPLVEKITHTVARLAQ